MCRKETTMMNLPVIENRSILTEQKGGFLQTGYSHSLNGTNGCAFAGAACGVYCYAQFGPQVMGREWKLHGVKRNVRDAYRRDYDRARRKGGRVNIYMSSACDPYQPHEATLKLTRGLLEEMLVRTPDVLVVQTRNPLVTRDLDLLLPLSTRCELWVSMTVETDYERAQDLGLPPHATPVAKRVEALRALKDAGVPAQAAVSPLLPLRDPEAFARRLGEASDRVVIDHYLLGDGANGLRTKRTGFPAILEAAGLGEWNTLAKFEEVKRVFERVLGPSRVNISTAGFNNVGK
jgi:DNA repair photolyase